MSLPDRIRAARQAACMTQGAVGSRLNPPHTRKNVCKWEHGHTEPSLATIEQLAAALGVTPCWLAFGCEVDHGK
jgi:transcriptional regulator with XRE-family HTH domain